MSCKCFTETVAPDDQRQESVFGMEEMSQNDFTPRKKQWFRAIERRTGKDARRGPFVVTEKLKHAINAVDKDGNERIFRFGVWMFSK